MTTLFEGPPDSAFSLSILPRPTKTYHSKTYDGISLKNSGFEGKGKTVFITGGASGIGLSITKAFANAGVSRIIILSRSPGPLESAKSLFADTYPNLLVETHSASITDHTKVSEILRSTSGKIDILVHSAAAFHRMDLPARSLPASEIQVACDTNVVGPFNLLATYLSLPYGGKTFINISTAGTYLRMATLIGYGPSKAAFAQMVEAFAVEESSKDGGGGGEEEKEKTRLFNVHPGAIATEPAKKSVKEDSIVWEDINLPADYCVWLAGPRSDYLHGRFLWPHWDVDELEEVKGRIEKDPNFLTLSLVQ